MLPERREELVRRRAQLQERLRQRQAAEIPRGFTQPLDEAGVVYTLADDEDAVYRVRDHFPIASHNRIDWSKVSECLCVPDEEVASESEWIAKREAGLLSEMSL